MSMRVVVTTVRGESRKKPRAARISSTAPTHPGTWTVQAGSNYSKDTKEEMKENHGSRRIKSIYI